MSIEARSLLREVFERMLGCFHLAEDSSSYYGGGGDEGAAKVIAEVEAAVEAADVAAIPPYVRVIRAALEQTGVQPGGDASRVAALALKIRDEQWRAFLAAATPGQTKGEPR